MASRPLRILDPKTPCSVDWGTMTGDDRVRHCAKCELDVYDLSKMTADEAAALFQGATGRVCGRFFRRADGTVVTRECETPVVRLGDVELDSDLARLLPREVAEKHGVILLRKKDATTVVLAMHDTTNLPAADDVSFLTGYRLDIVYAPEADIRAAIERAYDEPDYVMGEIMEDPTPPPELVPEVAAMSREFILAEVARSLRATHPDRADVMIREIEREALHFDHSGTAACPHCAGPVAAVSEKK